MQTQTQMLTEEVTDLEYDVPNGEIAVTCPYCQRPFRTETLAIYHIGFAHEELCTDEERAMFEAEREDEEFDLFTFHVKAAVSVFMVYFMFTFLYALVWAG